MIVVLDTNVIVSALLKPSSQPDHVLQAVVDGRLEIALSPHLRAEVRRALGYDQVRRRLLRHWSEEDLEAFLDGFFRLAHVVPDDDPVSAWVHADPDDNWVVQCALSGHAERIVTGDRALLALGIVEGISIVTPALLLIELQAGKST